MGEGSSAPIAQVVFAMARENDDHLDTEMNGLKTADDKLHLAYVLNLASDQQTRKANHARAMELASEAYDIAQKINNQDEAVYAQAIAFINGVELGYISVLFDLETNAEILFMARVRKIADPALRPHDEK